jgi:hypothetical protein
MVALTVCNNDGFFLHRSESGRGLKTKCTSPPEKPSLGDYSITTMCPVRGVDPEEHEECAFGERIAIVVEKSKKERKVGKSFCTGILLMASARFRFGQEHFRSRLGPKT